MRKKSYMIAAAVLLYLAYRNIQTLLGIPFEQWESMQWLMVALTVGLVGAGGLSIWRYYKSKK